MLYDINNKERWFKTVHPPGLPVGSPAKVFMTKNFKTQIIETLFALIGYKVIFIKNNVIGTLKLDTMEYIFYTVSNKRIKETGRYTSKDEANFAYYLI